MHSGTKYITKMDAKILTETYKDRVQKVAKYLEILIGFNKEHLKLETKVEGELVEKAVSITDQEIQILAYTAVAGDISTVKTRTGCQNYLGISRHSLNNAISKLQRVGLLLKTDRTRIHPDLQLDFKSNINLIITLNEQTRDSTEGGGKATA